MIRTVFPLGTAVTLTLVQSAASPATSVAGFSTYEYTPVWKFLQVVARVGTTLMFDLKVYGSHRFPTEGGVLLVSNHQSYLDPVLLGARLPRPLSYMAKASLFKIAPAAWFIRALGAFPVRQGEADIRALKEAIELAQETRR